MNNAHVGKFSMKTCPVPRRDGQPCRAPVMRDGTCWFHHVGPEFIKQRSNGGKASFQYIADPKAPDPRFRTYQQRLAFYENLAGKVLRGEISRDKAEALVNIACAASKDAANEKTFALRKVGLVDGVSSISYHVHLTALANRHATALADAAIPVVALKPKALKGKHTA